MSLMGKLVIPDDVLVLSYDALAEEVRSNLGATQTDTILTRPAGRAPSKVLDREGYARPDCRHVTQNGAGREIDIAPEVLERASCDAKLIGSLDATTPERTTTTVTPRLREQVFARDSARCTVPGCRSARNLEAHHIIEQARGGPHTLSNLTLLCSGHHAALHAGQLTMRGQAPHERQFRWTDPPPIPAGIDPRARELLIEQRLRESFGEPDREAGRAITIVPRSAVRGVPAGTSSERRPPSVAARVRSQRVRSGLPDEVAGGQLDEDALA